MPRKDPYTGCMVMTMPEFLAAEAEREGKGRDGGDILADIFAEIDADSRREENRMRKPAEALAIIKREAQEAADYWNDDEGAEPIPEFEKVEHVIEAQVSQNFRSSGEMLRAEVVANGKLYYVFVSHAHYAGTYIDPPEDDGEFYFGEFRRMSESPWKCCQCGRVREQGERHWTHIKQSDDAKRAVHVCPRCNGYEREKNKRRLERLTRKNRRERMRKAGIRG